jgi:hypothetical protein
MTNRQNISRRTIAKGAAWSVPVVAVAAAAPAASASTVNASLAWTNSSTSLLTLALLDGGGTITAQALVTVPTQLTITNGAGAISGQNATITITVARPAGINIPVGRARGFGVASYNGSASTSSERTATYQTAPVIGQFGFPLTTFTRTVPVTVAANGTLNMPVVWGLAGVSTGVSISALSTFGVTATIALSGQTLSANSSISVPVGAGIL